jgi:hypothetical protein
MFFGFLNQQIADFVRYPAADFLGHPQFMRRPAIRVDVFKAELVYGSEQLAQGCVF